MSSDNDYSLVGEVQPGNSCDERVHRNITSGMANVNSESINRNAPMQITEFSKLLTCLGDPSKFRMVARLQPAPGDKIEAVEPLFEKAVYSRRMNAIIIKIQSTIITIYASGIVTMTRLNDIVQAKELLNEVVSRINQSISMADPKSLLNAGKSRKRLDPMELTAYLPHTNCMKCGVKSCFYFSIMLAYSEAALEKCTPLQEARYSSNRCALEWLISNAHGPEVM